MQWCIMEIIQYKKLLAINEGNFHSFDSFNPEKTLKISGATNTQALTKEGDSYYKNKLLVWPKWRLTKIKKQWNTDDLYNFKLD